MGLARALLRPINSATTVLLGGFAVVWGLWLEAPWQTFSSAHIFDNLHTLAPEWVWGLVAVAVGFVVIYGALRPSYRSLVRGAGASGALWFFITLNILIGDWQNTAVVTYGFITLYSAFIYLNVKVNHESGFDWSDDE